MVAANDTTRRIDLVVSARDEASAMFQKLSYSLRDFESQGQGMFRGPNKSLNDFSGNFHSFIEEMKSSLGRGSTLFETAHLFEFGGAAIGLRVIGHEFEDLVGIARKALVETDRFSESGEHAERSWGFLSPGNSLVEGLQDIYAWTLKTAGADEEMTARTESAATAQLRLAEALKERKEAEKDLANRDKQVDAIVEPIHKAASEAGLSSFDKERAEALDKYQESLKKVAELENERNENLDKMKQLGDFSIGESSQTTELRNKYKAEDQRIIAEENSLPGEATDAYTASVNEISDRERKQKKEDDQRKTDTDRRKQDAKDAAADELESARTAAKAANLRAAGHAAEAEAMEREDHLSKELARIKKEERDGVAGAGDDPNEQKRIHAQAIEESNLAKQAAAAEGLKAQHDAQEEAAKKSKEVADHAAQQAKENAEYAVELARWREQNIAEVERQAEIDHLRATGKESEALQAEEAAQIRHRTQQLEEWRQQEKAAHPASAADIDKLADRAKTDETARITQEYAQKLAEERKKEENYAHKFDAHSAPNPEGDVKLIQGYQGIGGGPNVEYLDHAGIGGARGGVPSDPHADKLQQMHNTMQGVHEGVKELADLLRTAVRLLEHGGANSPKLLRAP